MVKMGHMIVLQQNKWLQSIPLVKNIGLQDPHVIHIMEKFTHIFDKKIKLFAKSGRGQIWVM